jgi:beta-glucosidase
MKRNLEMRKILTLLVLMTAAMPTLGQTRSAPRADSTRRIAAILAKMTLEEKIDYIGGTGFAIRAMPRLDLPAFEMSDGPYGARSNAGFPSTTYAAGVGLAATWNPDLAERVGEGIGKDARARGIHFMLGPGVNIYRSPLNGRNFEYFGEDPFLASAIAVGYIRGMQSQGVSATIKHFLGNNSEFDRHNSDSVIDERTLREIYLPAFEAAVKQAHVGAFMDSYNLVNGEHMTQNGYFNSDLLRKQWGFDGVMMSDWVATYDAVAAANGGLDLEMPDGKFMNRVNLISAVRDGRVSPAIIDEKVRHILQTAARFGWLDRDQADLSFSKYSQPNHELALAAARESMVLLKNDGNLLPLDKPKTKSVLVVGPDAYPAQTVAGGSAGVAPFAAVSILQGISQLVGTGGTVFYDRGLPSPKDLAAATALVTALQGGQPGVSLEVFESADLSGVPAAKQVVPHINEAGTTWQNLLGEAGDLQSLLSAKPKPFSKRWSGYYIAGESGPYELVAQGFGEGSGFRVYVDDKLIIDDWHLAKAMEDSATLDLVAGPHKIVAEASRNSFVGGRLRVGIANQHKLVSDYAKKIAAKADAVIIAAGFDPDSESEGADRTFALPFGQAELIRELAALNKNTVVVVTSGGGVDTNGWLDRVPALIEAWYPGENGGTALAEILFGDVNPSGRLPVTFERRWEDNPSHENYYPVQGSKQVEYKEGVFVGYRGYEHNHVQPQFPFGFGLSYTTFKYSDLAVTPTAATSSNNAPGPLYQVSFAVTNTGSRVGAAIGEVYISDAHATIPRPQKELKGFARVSLRPGETQKATVPLDARSFCYYDVQAKQWRADPGTFTVLVGISSQQIELTRELKLDHPLAVGN